MENYDLTGCLFNCPDLVTVAGFTGAWTFLLFSITRLITGDDDLPICEEKSFWGIALPHLTIRVNLCPGSVKSFPALPLCIGMRRHAAATVLSSE